MDVRFLKTISEAFIVKYSLQESLTVDSVFEDTYELIKELRDTDIELYEGVLNMSTRRPCPIQ